MCIRDRAFYVPTFVRNGVDNFLEMEVVPVMKDMKQQPAKSLSLIHISPEQQKVAQDFALSEISLILVL